MKCIALSLLVLTAAPSRAAEDAKAYVKSVLDNDAMGWTKARVTLRLTVAPKSGRARVRSLAIAGATIDGRAHTMVRFTEPADLAGTAMLMREEPSGATTQLLYQPAYDKVRPIGASSKNERFMGTDFSYADFEKRDTDKGNYRFLADAKCGKSMCRVVEVTPSSGLLSDRYGRIVFQIHPKAKAPLRTRFFGKDGTTELKTLTVNRLKKHQGRYVVFAATMADLSRGSKTRVDVLNIDFAAQFTLRDFSESALKGQ